MSNIDLNKNYLSVLEKIQTSISKRPLELQDFQPELVAVSKTQPVDAILQVYALGQRHFGENYVQELAEKSENLIDKCPDLKWHFIGVLQSNKVNKVLSVPNLHIVESVHKEKLAFLLNKNWPNFQKSGAKLQVMVQVNTSGEQGLWPQHRGYLTLILDKNGTRPEEASKLVQFVLTECPNLSFKGLMTIGFYNYNVKNGPNPDYLCLKKCREDVCKELNLDVKRVDLSMGMTADYEQAVELGSNNIRVGTAIFGPRRTNVFT